MLVDTHCHIHDARFDNDRSDVIQRARFAGLQKMISIGCDIETTQRAMSLAQTHKDIYFSAGFHPHEAQKVPANFLPLLKSYAQHSKCVAIGECGLDYYYDHSPRDIQRRVFEDHLKLSLEIKKTLVVHVRDAYEDCVNILSDFPTSSVPTVIHCFSGPLKVAEQFLALGCHLSIPGILTFKDPGDLGEVVRIAPIDRLLIETDSPYLAPLPQRGKRNEPSFVGHVAEKISELRGVPLLEIQNKTTQNAFRVFGLSDP